MSPNKLFNTDITVSGAVTTVSGVFDSVTVSGIPVNIGPGGGAGNITDINNQSGPSITVTGTGGINTITEGNTVTISGAGQFSPGYRGARLTTSSGIDVPNDVSTILPWDTVEYDTDGFHNPDNVATFKIPAGIRKIDLLTNIRYNVDAGGERAVFIQRVRDGSTFTFGGTRINANDDAATHLMNTASGPIEVLEGDEYHVMSRSENALSSPAEIQPADSQVFFTLQVLDPAPVPGLTGKKAFNGALVRKTTDQVVANDTTVDVTFDQTVYDTHGWVDLTNNQFIVPEGVTKVNVTYNLLWRNDSTLGVRSHNTLFNGSSRPGTGFNSIDAPNDATLHSVGRHSGAVEVSPGDTIRVDAYQNSGGNVDIRTANATWIQVEAVETNESFQIDEFAAVSGTFSQSLTVSGVPVNIGAGGGAGTITDINTSATGPSVTITGTSGVNTITDGNTITISGGAFSPGFRGAHISTTSGVAVADDTTVRMVYDKVIFDTDGFFNGHDGMTIPANVKKVRVDANINWDDDNVSFDESTYTLSLRRIRGGSDSFQSLIRQRTVYDTPVAQETAMETSALIDVEEGDEIKLNLFHRDHGGSATVNTRAIGDGIGMRLEVVDPAPMPGPNITGKQQFRGALYTTTSGVDCAESVVVEHPWDVTTYDTEGFKATDSRILIPAGVSRVILKAGITWDDDEPSAEGTERLIQVVRFPDAAAAADRVEVFVQGPGVANGADEPTAQLAVSPVINVVPGEYYGLRLRSSAAGTLSTLPSASANRLNFFSVEVVEDSEPVALNEIAAVSGTFDQTLTVSGVPVDIGGEGSSFSYEGLYLNPSAKPPTVHPKSDWFDDNSGNPTLTGTHLIDSGKWSLWDVDGVAHANNGKTAVMYDGSEPRQPYDTNIMQVIHDGTTTGGWLGYYQAAPAGDFTITARVSIRRGIFDGSAGGEENTMGIFIAEDLGSSPTTANLAAMSLHWDGLAPTSTDWAIFEASEWSDYNSRTAGSEIGGRVRENLWVRLWYRTSDDRVIFAYSIDGITWSELRRTTPIGFTPASIGFGLNSNKTFTSTGKIDFFAVASGVTSDSLAGHGRLIPLPTL
jgi:hypothetical protein